MVSYCTDVVAFIVGEDPSTLEVKLEPVFLELLTNDPENNELKYFMLN
jgi:hypothetical protein